MLSGLSNYFGGSGRRNTYVKQENDEYFLRKEKKGHGEFTLLEDPFDLESELVSFLDIPAQLTLEDSIKSPREYSNNQSFLNLVLKDDEHTASLTSFITELTHNIQHITDPKKITDILSIITSATKSFNPIRINEELIYACKNVLQSNILNETSIQLTFQSVLNIAMKNEEVQTHLRKIMSEKLMSQYEDIVIAVIQCLEKLITSEMIGTQDQSEEIRLILKILKRYILVSSKEVQNQIILTFSSLLVFSKKKEDKKLYEDINTTLEEIKITLSEDSNILQALIELSK